MRTIMREPKRIQSNQLHNVAETFTIKQQSALKSQNGTFKLKTKREQTCCEAAETVLPMIADCLCAQRELQILQAFLHLSSVLLLLLFLWSDGWRFAVFIFFSFFLASVFTLKAAFECEGVCVCAREIVCLFAPSVVKAECRCP